eukprot:gene5192-18416_t
MDKAYIKGASLCEKGEDWELEQRSHVVQGAEEEESMNSVELDFMKVDFKAWRRKILQKTWGPRQILLKDKLAFLLGTTQLW